MPFESFTGDHPNIKRFSLETPEKKFEPHFDPKRDLTEEDWRGMEGSLNIVRENTYWTGFVHDSAHMAILNYSRTRALLTPDDLPNIERAIENARSSSPSEVPGLIVHLIRLDGDSARALLTKSDMNAIVRRLGENRERNQWLRFVYCASEIAMFDYKRTVSLVTPEDWAEINVQFELLRDQGNWGQFLRAVERVATVDADRALSLISSKDWVHMIELIEKYRQTREWYQVALYASSLTTLSRLEEKAWKEKHQGLEPQTPPLPSTLHF